MKKISTFIRGICAILLLASCSDNFHFTNEGIPERSFDPSQPVSVNLIEPDSGVFNSSFVISGHNFGTDLSRIQVLFGDKNKAQLISSTGDYIYGLAPKQDNGQNSVKVVIDSTYTGELPTLFKYNKMEQISTVTGLGNTKSNKDGSLAEAAFRSMRGICVIDGNNVLVSTDFPNLRLISETDNIVTTVSTGVKFGSPCATKDKKKAYAIQYDGSHSLYVFTKEKAWMPTKLISTLGEQVKGRVCGCALTQDEKELYFCDTYGMFGKVDLETFNVEILNEKIGDMGGLTGNWCFMAYNKIDNSFYITAQMKHLLYRVTTDGKKSEVYAGGTRGYRGGYREEAMFATLTGIAIDDTGGIYLLDTNNGLIRYLKDDYVTDIAGVQGKIEVKDGSPHEARIKWGYDLDLAADGTLYFVESNAGMLRKFINQ